MTIDELAELVKRIRYKPGFELALEGEYFAEEANNRQFYLGAEQYGFDPYHLHFKMPAIDADDPNLERRSFLQKQVKIDKILLDRMDEEQMTRFIFHQIQKMESHECSEFFRLDGNKIYDPHRKERK